MYFKRGLRKIIADNTPADCYKFYKKNRKHEAEVSPTIYHEIVQKFNHLTIRAMIYENKEFVMPGRLGSMRILKREQKIRLNKEGNVDTKRLAVNYKKTKELWIKLYPGLTGEEIKEIPNKKVIFEYNEHTDGYKFNFIWNKITSNVKNQTAYYVEMTREAKTELSRALKQVPLLKNNFYAR